MANKGAGGMSRRELEEKIVARAWKDDAFRKSFVADPKGAFEKRLGQKLPAGLKIAAYEEDANHLHFVIPAKPGNVAELSDAELEKVAGGITPTVVVSAVMIASVIASATTEIATAVNENNKEHNRDHW